MKVLCIGHAAYDINCFMDEYPVENSKYRVSEKQEGSGGQITNQAIVLGKWNIETYLAAAVGSDHYGDVIKKELENFNIKTDFIETNFDKGTSNAIVMVNKTNGSRTVLNITPLEKAPKLKKEDFNIEPDVILTDGYEYHASMTAINKYPNAISIIDAGNPLVEVIELAKACSYIVTSKVFAEKVSGLKFDFNDSRSMLNVYNKLKEKYPKSEIVITLEDKGALYSSNNQIKVMPGIKVDVKDTTGAGDVFHAMFCYGVLNKYELEKAIALANVAAGLSCMQMGSKASIPSLADVITYYNNKMGEKHGVNTNQQNPQA